VNVTWTADALADVSAAVDYLVERGDAAAAVRLVERLSSVILTDLADGHVDGPMYVLGAGERVYGWPMPPFRIYYQRATGTLIVMRVYHQRRRPITRPT
jgi:plasmid stabilization system protein ParE